MFDESTSGSEEPSLDRKFNTAVTEASIKIDENIPVDGEDGVRRWVILHSTTESCRFPAGRTSIETIRERSQRV